MATSVMWQNHEKCLKMLLAQNFQKFYLQPSTKIFEQIEKFQCLKLSTNQGLSTGTGTGEGGEEY